MDLIYLFSAISTAMTGTNVASMSARLSAEGLGCSKTSNICHINVEVKSMFAREKFNISLINIHP